MDDASRARKQKSNSEIRRWYLRRIAVIANLNHAWIREGLSARDRAERAWRFRHEARHAARAMMADKGDRELLKVRDMIKYGSREGPSFDFLIARLKDIGVEGDEAYEAIIAGSSRTDSELNRLLGL